MWIHDYTRSLIITETTPGSTHSVDKWIGQFQMTLGQWVDVQLLQGLDSAFLSGCHASQPHMRLRKVLKKPTSSLSAGGKAHSQVWKKPTSSQHVRHHACNKVKKKPTSKLARKRPASVQFKCRIAKDHNVKRRIVVADESYLNKSKPGKLSKVGRPKKDQVWIWGAVRQGFMKTHFVFRILEHVDDAYNGRPRGKEEMVRNLEMLDLRAGDTFVSDKWKSTVAALKHVRDASQLTPRQLPHEIVNHSKGEIKNERGYTTNPIEAKWSVLKRWARKKYSGRLPSHSDRQKWRALVNEYQGRAMLSAGNTLDYGKTFVLPATRAFALFACA